MRFLHSLVEIYFQNRPQNWKNLKYFKFREIEMINRPYFKDGFLNHRLKNSHIFHLRPDRFRNPYDDILEIYSKSDFSNGTKNFVKLIDSCAQSQFS